MFKKRGYKKYTRKNKKTIKKRKPKKTFRKRKSTRNRNKKQIGGGRWLSKTSEEVVEKPVCPICLRSFIPEPDSTPEQVEQAIYRAECGHIFHNNCLLRVCQNIESRKKCPMCREPLTEDCNDVWAFRNRRMHDDNDPNDPNHIIHEIFDNEEVENIYNNQPPV
jgi:hypothetical protein